MITGFLVYLNVLMGVSITVYILLHAIFNNTIAYKQRLSLLFPAFSMVCYTLASIEWAYNAYTSYDGEQRWVIWFVVVWLLVMSVVVMAHNNWNSENA